MAVPSNKSKQLWNDIAQAIKLEQENHYPSFQRAMESILHKARQDEYYMAALLALQGEESLTALNAIQSWLHRSQEDDQPGSQYRFGIYMLVRLASLSGQLPQSLFLSGVDIGPVRDPVEIGGCADIFRGVYEGVAVAVKRLRFAAFDRKNMNKAFCREALVWRQLRHPHVLPFLGIDDKTFQETGFICMVSPWLSKGTLMAFIDSTCYNPSMRDRLLREVASGLVYLHSLKVVHGDIHGGNVFIDDDNHAMLADFGIAIMGDETAARITTTKTSAGTQRWMSPERTAPESENCRLKPASDVWAYGCLILLMYTKRLPFYEIRSDVGVSLKVLNGAHPSRPRDDECDGAPMSDAVWLVATQCWAKDPAARPPMKAIYRQLIAVEGSLLLSTASYPSALKSTRTPSFRSSKISSMKDWLESVIDESPSEAPSTPSMIGADSSTSSQSSDLLPQTVDIDASDSSNPSNSPLPLRIAVPRSEGALQPSPLFLSPPEQALLPFDLTRYPSPESLMAKNIHRRASSDSSISYYWSERSTNSLEDVMYESKARADLPPIWPDRSRVSSLTSYQPQQSHRRQIASYGSRPKELKGGDEAEGDNMFVGLCPPSKTKK